MPPKRSHIAAVVGITLAFTAVRGTAADPSVAQQQQAATLSRRASDLIDVGKLSSAESMLRQSLALVPGQPTRLYNLACVLTAEGKTADGMDALEQAAESGFTDFTILQQNHTLLPLHDSPRYADLLSHKKQIVHHAAELAIAALKHELGDQYLYEADEDHKLVFAVAVDQPTLDMLKRDLLGIETVEERQVFSHPPDEFIRIVIPTEADFSQMVPSPDIGGEYDDTTRMAVSMRLGQFMTHEFTHALHAADQHALGQEHPVWLSEGLASLYESAELDAVNPIPRDNSRLAYVRSAAEDGKLPPLDKLLRATREDFNAGPNLAYGEASYLLLFLQENGQLNKFYDAYTAGYASDATGATALQRATGATLAKLQKTFEKWIAQRPDPPTADRPGGPMLGVGLANAIDGLRVTALVPNGATAANIKIGDVLVGMDAREVRDHSSLELLLAPHEPGQQVRLRLRRGKTYLDIVVTLKRRSEK